jgi:nitroreductase
MNKVLETIAKRRSIRNFGPGQISDADLNAILEAALQAPSGHNDQSWFFSVIQDPKLIKELSDGSKLEMQKSSIPWMAELGKSEKIDIYHHAPTVIIAAAKKDAVTPAADVCAAIENILLAATSLGLGSCWIGFARYNFTSPEKNKKIGIPDGYEVHYGVALGNLPKKQKLTPPARKYEQYYRIIK